MIGVLPRNSAFSVSWIASCPSRPRVGPSLADKLVAFRYDVFRSLEKIAPNSGWFYQFGKSSSKRFYGHPALVSARFDCLKNGREVDVTATRYTTVVVTDVNMSNFRNIRRKCFRQVFFLNIGVEGVEHGFEIRMINATDVSRGIIHRV